jgi:N-acetylmuramoyl-L-alanine amidase
MNYKSVYIDAGHGGIDPGCPLGKGEKYYNLGVATELQKLLQSQGYEVEMSRHGDKSLSLKQRCQMANSFYTGHGGVFVSIHHDAVIGRQAQGMTTYYCKGSDRGWKLAEATRTAHRANMFDWPHEFRGTKEGNFYVLKHTKAPAILVECEFMTNEEQFDRIKQNEQEWFRHMAKLIFDSIKLFYSTK